MSAKQPGDVMTRVRFKAVLHRDKRMTLLVRNKLYTGRHSPSLVLRVWDVATVEKMESHCRQMCWSHLDRSLFTDTAVR